MLALSNQHVILTELQATDVDELFHLIDTSREHLSQHGDTTAKKYPTRQSLYDTIVTLPHPTRRRFAIRNHERTVVGTINVTPQFGASHIGEIGYYLGAACTGKGYMTHAVRMLTAYAFEDLAYRKLMSYVAAANTPSQRVLLRVGYFREPTAGDLMIFSLAREDWNF